MVPGNPRSVLEWLDARAPFSTPTRYGPALPTWSGTLLPAPEPGIDAAQVSVGIAAYSGTATLVTAYAYATWLPARTAAEHLDPFGFRAVTVGEDRLIPSSRQVTRTFTDPAVIARLFAFVNGLPPAAALTGDLAPPCSAATRCGSPPGTRTVPPWSSDGRLRDRCDHGERETAARPVGHACPPRGDGPPVARQRRLLADRWDAEGAVSGTLRVLGVCRSGVSGPASPGG